MHHHHHSRPLPRWARWAGGLLYLAVLGVLIVQGAVRIAEAIGD